MFYAYDKKTGEVVHEMQLPAGTCGNPMTYMVNGKQYIVVAVGAQNFPAELVALIAAVASQNWKMEDWRIRRML